MSPLVRTLETAAGVFGAEGLSGQSRLMLPTKPARHECTAHDAIVAPPTPPFVASAMCRERMGKTPVQHIFQPIKAFLVAEVKNACAGENLCDRQRFLKETKAAFPAVDFGEISDEDDYLWEKLHKQPLSVGEYPSGESAEQVTLRGIDFLSWLMKRYNLPDTRCIWERRLSVLRCPLSVHPAGLKIELLWCHMPTFSGTRYPLLLELRCRTMTAWCGCLTTAK